MYEQTDEELMLRVMNGDPAAYNTLFVRHKVGVWSFVRRLNRIEALAEEAFQETWLKVFRSRVTYKAGSKFRSWVFTIAANTSRDLKRRESRRIETVEMVREPPAPSKTMGDEAKILSAIDQLSDTLREPFILGALQGFDHNEIAEVLGISPSNARARMSRARATLRENLSQSGLGDES
tara:strand:+ start:92 stop:628 length:537 start_codon:yes stop_codon:yes gene_type:complete